MGKFKIDRQRYRREFMPWWESLTPEERTAAKIHFEKVREWNASRKHGQYPNMYDTTKLKARQLSEKQIQRIWVFKDHPENGNR